MKAYEIIILLCFLLPLAYGTGRIDEMRNLPDDPTKTLVVIIFFLSIVAAAVAITLRLK